MFTTCNECGTVFRIGPAELRVAEGQVRCGHCSATFNALATLTDEPPPTTILPQLTIPPYLERPAGPAIEAVAETAFEPDLEPEPEQELEPEPEPEPEAEAEAEAEPEPDISALDTVTGDETLEFNVPEDDWSEFFVEVPEPPRAAGAEPASETDQIAGFEAGVEVEVEEVEETPVYRIDAHSFEINAGSEPVPEDEPALVAAPPAPDSAPWQETGPEQEADSEEPDAVPEPRIAPAAAPQDATEPPIAPILIERPFEWRPEFEAPAPKASRRGWFGFGAAILALALALQLIHYRRDQLAAQPALYRPLTRIYAALNLSLLPDWKLDAYEVRSSEAVAGATTRGALDVLARIAVVGSTPTGLPLVRVILHDRFGKSLGSRVFTPDEYLDDIPQPAELLAPGYLIPVRVSLRDPGTDAFGYEVDVCVQYRRQGVVCQQEREQKTPFTR